MGFGLDWLGWVSGWVGLGWVTGWFGYWLGWVTGWVGLLVGVLVLLGCLLGLGFGWLSCLGFGLDSLGVADRPARAAALCSSSASCPGCRQHLGLELFGQGRRPRSQGNCAFVALLWRRGPEDDAGSSTCDVEQTHIAHTLTLGFSLMRRCSHERRILWVTEEVKREGGGRAAFTSVSRVFHEFHASAPEEMPLPAPQGRRTIQIHHGRRRDSTPARGNATAAREFAS